MGINYVEEHLNCDCYAGGKKPPVEVIHISKGTTDNVMCECNCVLLLLDGKADLFVNVKEKKTVNKGDFFFVPTNVLLSYLLMEDSKVLIIRTRNSLNLCQSFHVEDLFKEAKSNKVSFHSYKFRTLRMDEHLWDYANVMDKLLADQLKCINLLTLKIEEFMILLRAYYTKEELHDFFYFMLNPNSVFVEFVQMNWRKYKTVGEFASAMYISPQYFSKQFKKVFRKAPGVWMQEKKSELVLLEIQAGTKTYQEIVDEYGFSSQPHFNRFCKKMFKATPNELRKWKGVLSEIPKKIVACDRFSSLYDKKKDY